MLVVLCRLATMDQETKIRDESRLEIPGIRLGRELGRGGMAIVYEGSDLGFQPPRRVAVKIMTAALNADAVYRSRFEREAATVASFRHDNIVQIYESKEVDSTKYLVMEFLGGGTLAEHLRDGPLSVEAAVSTARILADALAYSHARDVVHRDFKPANVLFTVEGKPVLTDFGVAKPMTGDRTEFTRVSQIIGTPRYMAPEQEEGNEITDRADVYSFGLVFHEMLTGRLPPVRSICTAAELQAARASMRGLDANHAELICACLRWNANERPTAAECWDRLGATRSPRVRVWFVSGVSIAVAIGLALVAVHWGRQQQQVAAEPLTVAQDQIVVTPTNATIYLGGKQVTRPLMVADAIEQELLVVHPGYVGQVLTIRREGEPIVLEPLGQPTLAEHNYFVGQFFDRPASEFSLSTIPSVPIRHASLRELMAMKALHNRGETAELTVEARKVLELARRGDATARLVAFIAGEQELITVDDAVALNDLKAAMQEGYGLATFYYAMYLDSQYDRTRGRPDAVTKEILAALDLAELQGLADIASQYRVGILAAGVIRGSDERE